MTGVAGTGLLAALLFEPVAAGPGEPDGDWIGSGPERHAGQLQFAAVPAVTVR